MGFRTPSGQVTTTQSFKTIQIPRMVRGKPDAWDPLLCLEWADNFLNFLKATLDDHVGPVKEIPVWRVRFTPRKGVTVERLDETEVEDVVGGEDRVGFLPTWFLDTLEASPSPGNEPYVHKPPAQAEPY